MPAASPPAFASTRSFKTVLTTDASAAPGRVSLPPSGQTPATIDGYVGDTLYPSMFHQRFTPASTDAVLINKGFATPRCSREPFTMVDIGCGDGYGLILNAAAHPEATFIGIDASLGHVTRGRALIELIGLRNIELRHETIETATRDIKADYVTAQGVLSWVTSNNRVALLRLAEGLLKPGGALTIGYNVMPGWRWLLPFQQLVRAFASSLPGNATERFDAALALVRESGVVSDAVFARIDEDRKTTPTDYYAHEYLNDGWEPLWPNDVIAAAKLNKLEFVTNGAVTRWRDEFAMTRAVRTKMQAIPDAGTRELAIDTMYDSCFRIDVFVKSPMTRISDDERDERKLDAVWVACKSEADTTFSCTTTGGEIKFDNRAAHVILQSLGNGPMRLRDIPGLRRADVLNTMDALIMAGLVSPAETFAHTPHAELVNALVNDGTVDVDTLVTPHGALRKQSGDVDAMRRRLGLRPHRSAL